MSPTSFYRLTSKNEAPVIFSILLTFQLEFYQIILVQSSLKKNSFMMEYFLSVKTQIKFFSEKPSLTIQPKTALPSPRHFYKILWFYFFFTLVITLWKYFMYLCALLFSIPYLYENIRHMKTGDLFVFLTTILSNWNMTWSVNKSMPKNNMVASWRRVQRKGES